MNDTYDNNIDEVHEINDSPQTNHSSHPNHQHNTEDTFNEQQVEQEMILQHLPDYVQLNLKHFSNTEILSIKSVLNKAKAS
nr:replication protein [Staphylococcus aureus]